MFSSTELHTLMVKFSKGNLWRISFQLTLYGIEFIYNNMEFNRSQFLCLLYAFHILIWTVCEGFFSPKHLMAKVYCIITLDSFYYMLILKIVFFFHT